VGFAPIRRRSLASNQPRRELLVTSGFTSNPSPIRREPAESLVALSTLVGLENVKHTGRASKSHVITTGALLGWRAKLSVVTWKCAFAAFLALRDEPVGARPRLRFPETRRKQVAPKRKQGAQLAD
jgi:hypothetical protein